MKEELTYVVCIKSDWQKYFEVGEIYELQDNIPINKEGVKMVYAWNNHIRTTNINLGQFKKKQYGKKIYSI